MTDSKDEKTKNDILSLEKLVGDMLLELKNASSNINLMSSTTDITKSICWFSQDGQYFMTDWA